GAGLHLDIEVQRMRRCSASRELGALRQVPTWIQLHRLDVLKQLRVAQCDLGVAESGVVAGALLAAYTRVHAVADAVCAGLADEAVDDGVDGVALILLVFELKLHGDPWSV